MKCIALLPFLLCFLSVAQSVIPPTQPRAIVIKASPLGIATGTHEFSIEAGMHPQISAQLTIGVLGNTIPEVSGQLSYRGLEIMPGFRRYLGSNLNNPEGLYVGGWLSLAAIDVRVMSWSEPTTGLIGHELTTRISQTGFGLEVGYQWFMNRILMMDVGGGLRYLRNSPSGFAVISHESGGRAETLQYDGLSSGAVMPRLIVALGIML